MHARFACVLLGTEKACFDAVSNVNLLLSLEIRFVTGWGRVDGCCDACWKVIEYCKYHHRAEAEALPEDDKNVWDKDFVKVA